jgi:hypothetical protein
VDTIDCTGDSRHLIKPSLPHRISSWCVSSRILRLSLDGIDHVLSRPTVPGQPQMIV